MNELQFDNTFSRLPEALFQRVRPQGLTEPFLVSANPEVAQLIGLEPAQLQEEHFLLCCGGHQLPKGADPLAMVYSGHQFGIYNPQLGDGRAILLGEVRTRESFTWDLHLKGAGPTPYSRHGDGRAVLRSCIREYLASQALHSLGIPSSLALAVTGSRQAVYREQVEPGATLLRIAPSHVRFGTFEYLHHTGRHEALPVLADHVIAQHFPALAGLPDRHARLFDEVVAATARLIAQWQAFGFCHGVMNTDNMSIIGQTLDYGPFAFMDDFHPGHACNHSDHTGRYAFDQQPTIGLWNCHALAMAMSTLVKEERLREGLECYRQVFREHFLLHMRRRLGLLTAREEDEALVGELLEVLASHHADYNLFFRRLARFEPDAENPGLRALLGSAPRNFDPWARRYAARLAQEPCGPGERAQHMDAVNPLFVLRNYLTDQVIRQLYEDADPGGVEKLLELLRSPFREHPGAEDWAKPAPQWGKNLQLSCSS